jgi:hypothetical protein
MTIRGRRLACLAVVTLTLMFPAAQDLTTAAESAATDLVSHPSCDVGTIVCVDRVVGEMNRRFRELASSCDHDAVFALVYLRTTEEYFRTVADNPNFFVDTPYVNREDAAFANLYFVAFDNWPADFGTVPPAWQTAFDAADRREVSGSGNILLGINAHINRDLPFVLFSMGLTHPDGSSRKPDHDKVNEILWRVSSRGVLQEAARRFDPAIDDANLPGTTLDDTALFQLIVAWRERAWWNAVRLASARTTLERQAVAADIEQSANAIALGIKASNSYVPPVTASEFRDAYCAAHRE